MVGNLGLSCLNLFWLRKMGKFVVKALKHAGVVGRGEKGMPNCTYSFWNFSLDNLVVSYVPPGGGKGLLSAVGDLDDNATVIGNMAEKKSD